MPEIRRRSAIRTDESENPQVSVLTLTREIVAHERTLAPGSETLLWGEYIEEMRRIGVDVLTIHQDEDPEPTVDAAEGAWWLGAYAALLTIQEATVGGEIATDADGVPLLDMSTDLPSDTDLSSIADTVGIDVDRVRPLAVSGWLWAWLWATEKAETDA